ncbi:MAG: Tex family protein [Planctomycetaceae bacterium]
MTQFELARQKTATGLGISEAQVDAVVSLLDEGNTVPFITRYRKEKTGGLDEEQIRTIRDAIDMARQVVQRAETILAAIEKQGKLNAALRKEIEQADSLKRLEDLYLPYKQRRRSRADAARERGLESLANSVWDGRLSGSQLAAEFNKRVGSHEELTSVELVESGVVDVLAERVAESVVVRDIVREVCQRSASIEAKVIAKSEESATYRDYDGFSQRINRIPPHRILAMNRGEREKALRVKVVWDFVRAEERCERFLRLDQHRASGLMRQAVSDALGRLVNPSVEREVRRDLTDTASQHAIQTFSKNLRSLLLQPPLRNTRVLAIDPGFRTGCKLVALDEQGHVLDSNVIYLTGSDDKIAAMRRKLADLISKYECRVVAIGNGTGCREAEQLVSQTLDEHELDCRYIIVNEAGASIYSASDVARDEFPELDATVRGTISIGRRLQDPLSELVKIEPQHVGVGMYQHDVDEKALKKSLDEVVESCVNNVGVDLNSASAALLSYVSGLNQSMARKIVSYRTEHGKFRRRADLLNVAGLGATTFTQAAGFLRISDGVDPLDNTWIHPESYPVAQALFEECEISRQDFSEGVTSQMRERLSQFDAAQLSKSLRADASTIQDILTAVSRPVRDPREELPGPVFRSQVLSLDELSEGMELSGVVLNVVDFGAFIDVGLKDSGLVHISQMSRQFVDSPFDIVSVGEPVTVWVLSIDRERKRLSLTMVPEVAAN